MVESEAALLILTGWLSNLEKHPTSTWANFLYIRLIHPKIYKSFYRFRSQKAQYR